MPFDIPACSPISDVEILLDARDRIARQEVGPGRSTHGDRHRPVAALSLER